MSSNPMSAVRVCITFWDEDGENQCGSVVYDAASDLYVYTVADVAIHTKLTESQLLAVTAMLRTLNTGR